MNAVKTILLGICMVFGSSIIITLVLPPGVLALAASVISGVLIGRYMASCLFPKPDDK